jgi:hypothetical protein
VIIDQFGRLIVKYIMFVRGGVNIDGNRAIAKVWVYSTDAIDIDESDTAGSAQAPSPTRE